MKDTIFLDISKRTVRFVTIVLFMVIAFFIGFTSGFITGFFFDSIIIVRDLPQIEQKGDENVRLQAPERNISF